MSKVLVIPDVHQQTETLDLISGEFDECVMLGDYEDHWESGAWWDDENRNPIAILERIRSLKEKYGKRLHVLLGNHDLTYLSLEKLNEAERYLATCVSGHQKKHESEIASKMDAVADMFEIACEIDGVVYSHAGFSGTWTEYAHRIQEKDEPSIISIMNKLILKHKTKNGSKKLHVLLDHASFSPSGNSPEEGPLWIRPEALKTDMVFKKQIVGHTEYDKPTMVYSSEDSFLFVADSREHLIPTWVIDGKPVLS